MLARALAANMKPIHINFIRDESWRWIWAATAVICLCVMGFTAWQWYKTRQSIQTIQADINTARKTAAQLGTPKPVLVDPRKASTEQTIKLLQQDLNKVFNSAESPKEAGVRLRSLNMDSAAGTLRLEFELDSLPRASSITAVLNAGYEDRPWQLESVTGRVVAIRRFPHCFVVFGLLSSTNFDLQLFFRQGRSLNSVHC